MFKFTDLFHGWYVWFIGILAILLGTGTVGCASWKATDNTKALDYITRGEEHPQQMTVPGELLGPQYAGKVFVLASTPGKDVELIIWNPDGTKHLELRSSRSATLDKLFAGALGLNQAAFDEGGKEWSRAFELIQFIVSTAKSAGYLTPPTVNVPSGNPAGGTVGFDAKLQALVDRLASIERALGGLPGAGASGH